MKPALKKLLVAQVLFLGVGLGVYRYATRDTDEDLLVARAGEVRSILGRGDDEAAVREMVFEPELARIGVELVHVRAELVSVFVGERDKLPEAERGKTLEEFRESDLIADLRKRATEWNLAPDRDRLGAFRILLEIEDPAVSPEDLEKPEGEAAATELAVKFLARVLEERFLAFDRNRLAFVHVRDLGPEVRKRRKPGAQELEDVPTGYLRATVRFTDGRENVDLTFHQRRIHFKEDPRWYVDLSGWYEGGSPD